MIIYILSIAVFFLSVSLIALSYALSCLTKEFYKKNDSDIKAWEQVTEDMNILHLKIKIIEWTQKGIFPDKYDVPDEQCLDHSDDMGILITYDLYDFYETHIDGKECLCITYRILKHEKEVIKFPKEKGKKK